MCWANQSTYLINWPNLLRMNLIAFCIFSMVTETIPTERPNNTCPSNNSAGCPATQMKCFQRPFEPSPCRRRFQHWKFCKMLTSFHIPQNFFVRIDREFYPLSSLWSPIGHHRHQLSSYHTNWHQLSWSKANWPICHFNWYVIGT